MKLSLPHDGVAPEWGCDRRIHRLSPPPTLNLPYKEGGSFSRDVRTAWDRRKGAVNWLALATIAMMLAAALAVAYALSLKTEPEIRMGTLHTFVGAPAPASTLEDLDGRSTTDLIQLRGKLVLLILWGPWDPTSIQLAPHWNALWQRHREDPNFAMVTVVCESAHEPLAGDREAFADSIRDLLERAELSFPVWQDPEGLARAAFFMDQGEYPLTALIGPEGFLRAVWYGPVPGMQAELERLVERYLDEFDDS